ncbi:ribbon-helix-helix domain-containing protein [Mammaliicoccus sciuri]|nr:ribbon-helix-helix domain-containing protein [Mammaliicoccus sciuri]RIN97104.1 ribbon-helix-helix domain-containing protein [Mammaliicoccus sciuri]
MTNEKVSVRIDRDQYEQLKKVRENTGVPLAGILRRAIESYLKSNKKEV